VFVPFFYFILIFFGNSSLAMSYTKDPIAQIVSISLFLLKSVSFDIGPVVCVCTSQENHFIKQNPRKRNGVMNDKTKLSMPYLFKKADKATINLDILHFSSQEHLADVFAFARCQIFVVSNL